MRIIGPILFLVWLVLAVNPAWCASPWVFTMADTVRVSTAQIHLSDLTSTAIPAPLTSLIVGHSGLPGTIQNISRKMVLRQIVTEGMAGGISFRGATSCVVVRTGETLNPHSLRPEIRRALQPLVPKTDPGAPATWFELQLPDKLGVVDDLNYRIRVAETALLKPGRNHISIELLGNNQNLNFSVMVTLHQFRETAKARLKIKRGHALDENQFVWEWADLAQPNRNSDLHGRDSLLGASCGRTIQAGDYLRQSDLKPTPVVLTGDRVELQITRGTVSVSVNATARREGSVGQTIPVRNELTKQLVNARVVGPGMVKWRN